MRRRAGEFPGWERAVVAVDGIEIHSCVEVDTGEGWADVIATDDAGRAIFDGDRLKLERLHGAVRLEIPA